MSPFLADVQVIHLPGVPGRAAIAAVKPEARAQVDAAVNAVRALADEVREIARDVTSAGASLQVLNAKAALVQTSARTDAASDAAQSKLDAAQAKLDAAQATMEAAKTRMDAVADDNGKDNEDSDNVTIQKDGKSIVVHHAKSHRDEDIPFAVLPIFVVTFTFLYLIVRALMSPFTKGNRRAAQAPVVAGLTEEEIVVLEKLQRTLAQMETRVESLETILIDQTRTKEKYGTKL